MRVIVPYLLNYRALLFGWLGFLVLSSLATLSLPLAVRVMIDHGFAHADPATINRSFVGLLAVASVMAVATAGRYFCVSMLGERVVADLRRKLYAHLLTLDQAFYERTRVGELTSRLGTDTELVQTVVSSSMSVALRGIVTAVGGAVMLVLTSPKLAGYAALVIPLVILPIVVAGRRQQKLARANQDRIADAAAIANETLNAMYAVQAYAREPVEKDRYDGAIARALKAAQRRVGQRAGLTALVILLIFGAITLVLWAGARAVMDGSMSAGVLGQFVLYAVFAAGSLGGLTEVWSEISRAGGSMERIGELLAATPDIATPASPVALATPMRGEIRFDHVEFRYPSRPDAPTLHDFSLRVAPGETVALVGPSGAGKSTVFHLVAALLRSAARQHFDRWRGFAQTGSDRTSQIDRARPARHRHLRRKRLRQHPIRTQRCRRRFGHRRGARPPKRMIFSRCNRKVTRRISANAAFGCPADSNNASRSLARY